MKESRQNRDANKNQGEGNVEAARRYNEDQKRFVERGEASAAARRAAPRNDDEAREMQQAEQAGRSHAKGEDPAVPDAHADQPDKPSRRPT